MNYRRGDVVLVLFSDPNPQTAKQRPALVVQADRLDGSSVVDSQHIHFSF